MRRIDIIHLYPNFHSSRNCAKCGVELTSRTSFVRSVEIWEYQKWDQIFPLDEILGNPSAKNAIQCTDPLAKIFVIHDE